MVIVNTVVIVKGGLALGDGDVAWALASFGAGSMLSALNLPRILDKTGDRPVMLTAAGAMAVILARSGLERRCSRDRPGSSCSPGGPLSASPTPRS